MDASDVIHEIKDFMRERIKIECIHHSSSFGSTPYMEIRLMMDDEEISAATFDVPSEF